MTFPRRPRKAAGEVLFVDPFREHFCDTWRGAEGRERSNDGHISGDDAAERLRSIRDPKRLARIAGMPEAWCDEARLASALTCRDTSHDVKFEQAAALLDRFAAARLIVTSRLHAALPATAMGVPCLFVLKDDATEREASIPLSDHGHDCTRRDPRFSGLIEHLRQRTFSQLLDGSSAEGWEQLAAQSPNHDPAVVEDLTTRVREFLS